uniref:Uncharacterized protein n=1 Tax=Caenorhabditis japonica TaxID=281687 RepID=A0A8R1HKP1_CAEJA
MAKIHRECREKSLPAIRLSRPIDYFSDISDWTNSKRYYVKNRDIVRENIRVVKSSLPRLPTIRKVPPFCPQSYQPNTSVVPLPMISQSRSKSVDSNVTYYYGFVNERQNAR